MADWVIVVDDDITNLKMAGHILSRQNMRVTALKSGTALIEYVKTNQPDLILLDIMMPGLDGFETMKILKEQMEPGKEIPIIFLTADENQESEMKGLQLGAMDFIRKPFAPEILVLRVKHTIELVRLQRNLVRENERISAELAMASRIQLAMLPSVFQPFPDHPEIDIFASMDPVREIGGDFYDFFLVDDDHLCLIMADVSGKGMPAALFMMASKIVLMDTAKMGKSPGQILEDANTAICSYNREGMFVTVWLGILELSTGLLTTANAGHEYPVVKEPGQPFQLLKAKHGLVIGGMPEQQYRDYTVQLSPGVKLFVYTDGVTEATSDTNELFGTKRLVSALNRYPQASPEQLVHEVRKSVDEFVNGTKQFDDLTMMCLEYKGPAVRPVSPQAPEAAESERQHAGR